MKFPRHINGKPRPGLAGLFPSSEASTRLHRHIQSPRNAGRLDNANGKALGVGSCGDSLEVYLQVENQQIRRIGHVPHGCGFTVACASAMSQLVEGLTLEEALRLTPDAVSRVLGGLPEDHRHCAALAVNTLGEAIEDCLRRQWGKSPAVESKISPE